METIKFANGETHSCAFLSTIPDGATMKAIIALDDVDFPQAATIFSNQDLTSEMEYASYRLIGYTSLEGVYVQPYGIQAVLNGGHDERIN